jgi:hypothetical protein
MSSRGNVSTAADTWRPHFLARIAQLTVMSVAMVVVLARLYAMIGLAGNDWGKFYWDAVAWLDHRPMYGVNPATWVLVTPTYGQDFYDLAAPHFLLLFLVVAHLGFQASLLVWAIASTLGAAITYWIVARELGEPTNKMVFYAVPIVLLSDLLGTVVISAQITFLVLPLVAQTWVWVRHERWLSAALVLGLLIAVKPFFLLLLPWMAWRGTWRVVPAALASFSLVVALGLLVFGRATYETWIATLAGADWYWLPMNASLRGPFARALTDNPAYLHFADAPVLAALLWRIAFVVLATLVLGLAALDKREGGRDRTMALLLVSAIFLSPLGWTYYLWWTLPPLAAVLKRNPRPASSVGAIRNALLVVTVVIFGTPSLLLPILTTSVVGHLLSGTQFVGLACLWTACVLESATAVRASLPVVSWRLRASEHA